MRRGEIWSVAGRGYASKPRPVLVVQSDGTLPSYDSVVVCLLTSVERDDACRVRIEDLPETGLRRASWVMADKILAVRKDELGSRIGKLPDADMTRVSRALRTVLGL
ncbi:type II toxin-antitoxin system PemK/MazF family toxin [Bifidobacterium phasiani]|uniref:Type II toxin-antitoxin system PemK/MazF family toxin n=1 Tax=Bifidobacterium phasiani TaxID=2834431 RepID=A0ABS6W6W7_9BIFI|nr:type II toxin-antitoxin system PemK/MazF family toxin [Bifidobacterium phasiani]MBW3081854.1 type II toxin-antitoxin system PemK/MazF family toxin [Bifidobacterium phasiani]